MHIILTGATGLCGAAVLQHCLSSPVITRVTILSRSPVPRAEGHAKASVVLHKDFSQYPQSALDKLQGAEGCVWALGTSTANYIELTHTYTIAAAKAFAKLSDPFKFVFVSGEGTQLSSSLLFGKIKGRTEKDLHELLTSVPSLRTFAVRPGLIDPEGTILRRRKASEYVVQTIIGPILRWVSPSNVIGTKPLSRVLVNLVTGDGTPLPAGSGIIAEGRTVRNTAIRSLAGL